MVPSGLEGTLFKKWLARAAPITTSTIPNMINVAVSPFFIFFISSVL